jgi:hypothetical protein
MKKGHKARPRHPRGLKLKFRKLRMWERHNEWWEAIGIRRCYELAERVLVQAQAK